ncbi:nickel-responsive transcriptional regulator NikR [Methanobacterium formicicum]|nr:nickel-responsive transcriptional regulator NikR [Methanobacterium formicicum]
MRISMSLPRKLLGEFDEVLRDRGYNSRSKGIRDALEDYIIRYQWMQEMEGERMGTIAVIFEYHYTDVLKDLADIQHDFRKQITAVMRTEIGEKYCQEIIVVKGDVKHIRDLTEKIKRLKGVEHVKLTITVSKSSSH